MDDLLKPFHLALGIRLEHINDIGDLRELQHHLDFVGRLVQLKPDLHIKLPNVFIVDPDLSVGEYLIVN